MVRTPSYDKNGLKRGTWTPEEDSKLIAYVTRYGCWNWRQLPRFAGLARCGKSCRLRWLNYLRPNIKRGNYSPEEEETIITLHKKLGNKWSVIATHLPGRTDNEIKNHWHTTLKKRFQKKHENIKSNDSGSDQHVDSVHNNGQLSPQLSSTEFSSTTTDHTTDNLVMEDNIDFIDANIETVNENFWTQSYEGEISYTPTEKVPDYGNGNSDFQDSDATETFMNSLVMYPQSSSSSESCSVQENDHFAFLEATATQSSFENFWTQPYVAMSHVPNELLTPLVIEPDQYFSTVYDVDLWSQSHFNDERISFFH